MSLLKQIAPDQATGEVGRIYAEIKKTLGHVPSAFRIWSASPLLLGQQWELVQYSMNHPTLSGALLASIRLLVSSEHNCAYCVGINAGMLINLYGHSASQVEALKRAPDSSPLPERDKAMLLFALQSVDHPESVTADDLEALRQLGWNDHDILDAASHAARMVASDLIYNTFKLESDF